MKKIFISFFLIFTAFTAKAQMSEQVNAILQVGDEVSVFYGAGALVSALNAAPESGGVITLSSGTFNAATITKRVKIYGCAWFEDVENDIYPTNINGSLTINLPEDLEAPHDIYFEGLYISSDIIVRSTIDGLNIVKCSVNSIPFSKTNTRVSVVQSYVRSGMTGCDNLVAKNCYLSLQNLTRLSDESSILIDHCMVVDGYNFDSGASVFICQNSIVNANANYIASGGAKIFKYCVFGRSSWTQTVGSGNNWFNVDYTTFFSDAENTDYADTRTFELANPDDYLGSDGTPVGPVGGDYPWNILPQTPVVKNLELEVEGTQLKVTYDAEVR